jgi:DNA helicase-2/ATP-dependent DNA helicase PcrA
MVIRGNQMLSKEEFDDLLKRPEIIGRELNQEQKKAVFAPAEYPLLIIAGPGSGKTTVLVVRALRLLLVDALAPEQIVITTFTKKAAAEIRTRWLVWGQALVAIAKVHPSIQADRAKVDALDRIDLNRCTTGTLDSICESMLGDNRSPLEVPPTLVDQFTANQLLLRSGLRDIDRQHATDLRAYLGVFGAEIRTLRDLVDATRPFVERFIYDHVDRGAFARAKGVKARKLLVEAFDRYQQQMDETARLDFARLEARFLERLQANRFADSIRDWKALLVDEYQDTNPLQEAIYFELAKRTTASLTVVGDDDQSVYRFRGATVELFANFPARAKLALNQNVGRAHLLRNYRSTPEIINFYNAYVAEETEFSGARIQPAKAGVVPARASLGLPVLGMFRQDVTTLARDLAVFLHAIFRGHGVRVPTRSGERSLRRTARGGDVGDAVLLASSVREWKSAWGANVPEPRLPNLLRAALGERGIAVFNPRGQSLRDQEPVQLLLGLMLECLDPSNESSPQGELAKTVGATAQGHRYFDVFRSQARALVSINPKPNRPHALRAFVEAWNAQRSQTTGQWPDEWPLLELCFTLITWIPSLLNDPEQQIWLEAITRTIAQAALFSPYRSSLLKEEPHRTRSRTSAIRDVIRPIAENLIDVDEDLITHQPRDSLNVMTIHQAKGLEFPLVIVDVSSDYKRNHPSNAFKRFPSSPSNVALLEDELAGYCEVGPTRRLRTALDRSFDDLVRQYYVAYSRPQTCLLLVGLDSSLGGTNPVKSVATGWQRDGSWSWRTQTGKKPPALANRLPFQQI